MDNETQAGMPEVTPLLIEIDPVESATVQPKAVMEMGGNQGSVSTRAE